MNDLARGRTSRGRTAMGDELEIPAVYGEDDTPRRFKNLMAPKPAKSTKSAHHTPASAPREDGPWTVRPGETFRDFNARIRAAGLSTPPGIPETFRGAHPVVKRSTEDTTTDPQDRTVKRPAPVKPMPKFLPAAASPENEKKRKRKEALKQRKATKRARAEGESDYDEYEIKGLRDVVKAPPQLVTPKATLKMNNTGTNQRKKAPSQSLLPLIKPTGKKNEATEKGSKTKTEGKTRHIMTPKRPKGSQKKGIKMVGKKPTAAPIKGHKSPN